MKQQLDEESINAENEWWNLISQEERQAIEKGLADIEAGRTISHNEMRKRYELLQSHYILDELNARIDEAENDIDAGRVYTSEQVHDILEKKYPWLCK